MSFIWRWLGLCEHRWIYVPSILTADGPYEVLICEKCQKKRYIRQRW
jgi:hypothetical protein